LAIMSNPMAIPDKSSNISNDAISVKPRLRFFPRCVLAGACSLSLFIKQFPIWQFPTFAIPI
jgi:hypothetical protein